MLPGFLSVADAQTLFNRLLHHVPWQQVTWNGRPFKRLVYRASPDDPIYQSLNNIIHSLEANGINTPKGIFLNLYRDENDLTPYHKDTYGVDIFTLSLGATRTLRFKPDNRDLRSFDYRINSGDLYGFTQAINATHQHMIPKPTKKQLEEPAWQGARISIVFFC